MTTTAVLGVRVTEQSTATDLAAVLDAHTGDASGFLRATRRLESQRVSWAKRVSGERAIRRLRRG